MPGDIDQTVGACEIALELRCAGTGMVFRDVRRFTTIEEASESYDRLVEELTRGLVRNGGGDAG